MQCRYENRQLIIGADRVLCQGKKETTECATVNMPCIMKIYLTQHSVCVCVCCRGVGQTTWQASPVSYLDTGFYSFTTSRIPPKGSW